MYKIIDGINYIRTLPVWIVIGILGCKEMIIKDLKRYEYVWKDEKKFIKISDVINPKKEI